MSWTQTDLDALNSSISKGVSKVVYRDRTVEYRSQAEMMKLKSMMEIELGTKPLSTRLYYSTGKGL